jgi:hypothetical protein
MRHASIKTTMHIYGDVVTDEMSTASRKVQSLRFRSTERKQSADRARAVSSRCPPVLHFLFRPGLGRIATHVRLSTVWSTVRRVLSLRRLGLVALGIAILALAVLFVRASVSAWHLQNSASLTCATPFDPKQPLSYVQYGVTEQTAESYFRGSLFVSLGDVPNGPSQADVVTTGGATSTGALAHT